MLRDKHHDAAVSSLTDSSAQALRGFAA